MNQPISVKDLVDLLRKDHPGWTDAVLDTEARSMRETLDPRLAELLARHARTGATPDFRSDQLNVLGIRALRKCSYLEAVRIMDAYLIDHTHGMYLLTRRGTRA